MAQFNPVKAQACKGCVCKYCKYDGGDCPNTTPQGVYLEPCERRKVCPITGELKQPKEVIQCEK